MNNLSLKEAAEAFTKLTDTLQECINTQDIEGAMALAEERHDTLVVLLENSEIEQIEKVAYAKAALSHVRNEHILAKLNANKHRSDFIARKLAYRAYTSKAA